MLLEDVTVATPHLTDGLEAIGHQIGLVVITVYAIQFLKRVAWFPWLNANSDKVTNVVSTVAALAAALFVEGSLTMTGDASTGWHFVGSIPSLHVMWHSFIRFAGQKAGQDWFLRNVAQQPKPVALVLPEKMDVGGKPEPEKLVVAP